jgi:thiamine biosynthesis protein ThiI
MMMKRGCRIVPLYVALEGALDATNLARAEKVVEGLRAYQPDISLLVLSDTYLSSARQVLLDRNAEKYTCLLCKRRMYRLAERVARERRAKGIVTGESLGQVASQTLDNLAVLTDAAEIPLYRPLIGFDKEETIRLAKEIGTFDLSISPASSCRAVPHKPATTASIATITALEEAVEASCGGRED